VNSVAYNDKSIIPSKVVCIGRNYVEHIKELNNEMPTDMVIFCKPNSSVSSDLIEVQGGCHYESELSFLIVDNSPKAVAFGLDITKRDVQSTLKSKGLPWERAKAFDNSAVFSDFVDFGDIAKLYLKLYINDKLVQEGGYELMIHKPNEIIDEISTFMSFEDRDILMSGTPKGVGSYKKGDRFSAYVYEDNKELIKKEWVVK
jgi:2-keto-4-pentenoate hydratase/2-oxohepta-3-ene-1,7-dioic acid hydratase in catechol pathway